MGERPGNGNKERVHGETKQKRPGVRVQIFFSKGELTWEGFLLSRFWARKIILLTACVVFYSLLFSSLLFFSRLCFYFSVFLTELAGLSLRARSNSKPFDVGYEAGSGTWLALCMLRCFVNSAAVVYSITHFGRCQVLDRTGSLLCMELLSRCAW
ncbi:hypothetical protein VTN02DRAFT_202 [Thermoascus thermophilus]